MIRSQMISFRPDSQQERNLTLYIALIEEVFAMIKENSSQTFSVNTIASSIRQVVLKNDSLDSKNDLLDFFFLCQKSINQASSKNKKTSKNWAKIIQNKINQLKGLQSLRTKFKTIPLKWAFDSLFRKNTKPVNTQPQIDIESASIEVEEDIKLKTLYFFKWCKFIEYGKSIKKLRLKEIDDLRKSLTFNMYAVKFSYFHNWRRQAKQNASNRQKFNHIQKTSQRDLFRNTVDSFYSLFEIKKIEEKLVSKVEESLQNCKKQWVFQQISANKVVEVAKSISALPSFKLNSERKSQVEKIKYRFLYFLANASQIQQIKSRTLTANSEKSRQAYSLLCAKTALQTLKTQFYETKENIVKIQQARQKIAIEGTFNGFMNAKLFEKNLENLSKTIRQTKLKRFLNVLKMNSEFQKQLDQNFSVSFQCLLSIKSNRSILIENAQTCQSLKNCARNQDLYKYLEYTKLKKKLEEKLSLVKKQIGLIGMKKFFSQKQQMQAKVLKTIQARQSLIFSALTKNRQIKHLRTKRKNSLTKIYQQNLLKFVFSGMQKYKFIRLSHEQTLENIEQTIINPKQLLTALNRIYQRNRKILSCEIILTQINKLTIRTVFKKCFNGHIQTLKKAQEMQKQAQLKKLDLLFTLLKKNKEYNDLKSQEIRKNIISKLNKAFFIKNLKSNKDHAHKFIKLCNFNLEQGQQRFIISLKERKDRIVQHCEKFDKAQKMLGLSLLRKKIVKSAQQYQEMSKKCNELTQSLNKNKFSLFVSQLNRVKIESALFTNKFAELSCKIIKEKFIVLMHKINYEKSHSKTVIQTKADQIFKAINFKSFINKFKYEAKNSYLKRWTDWRQKQNVFQKLEANQNFSKKITNVQNKLNQCKTAFGLSVIKENIEKEKQAINTKTEQLSDVLGRGRKKQIRLVTQKVKSMNETEQNTEFLVNALRAKYLAKFMRNSLIIKYEKVKEFCAIRSYARKLKEKSLNGLKIMLMRLRDKENRLKTEQELMVKVDKAMYNSRKSNQLSDTIQRFNNMKRSLTINALR